MAIAEFDDFIERNRDKLPSIEWLIEELDCNLNTILVHALRWKMEWHNIGAEREAHYHQLISDLLATDPSNHGDYDKWFSGEVHKNATEVRKRAMETVPELWT